MNLAIFVLIPFTLKQNIVADMRKVLAKNPQIEQQKLHRRIFLDTIDPENQALMVLCLFPICFAFFLCLISFAIFLLDSYFGMLSFSWTLSHGVLD